MDGTLKLLDIVRIAGEINLETGMTIGGIDTFGIGGIHSARPPQRQTGSSFK